MSTDTETYRIPCPICGGPPVDVAEHPTAAGMIFTWEHREGCSEAELRRHFGVPPRFRLIASPTEEDPT